MVHLGREPRILMLGYRLVASTWCIVLVRDAMLLYWVSLAMELWVARMSLLVVGVVAGSTWNHGEGLESS